MHTILIFILMLAQFCFKCTSFGGEVSLERRSVINVPTASLAALSHGMTEYDVEKALGARGNHQVTALISNDIVRVTAYYRNEIYGKYYLVFTNRILSKVCEPPPFEMGLRKFGNHPATSVRLLGDPETRLSKVLAAPDLIGPELVAALRPAKGPKRRTDPGLAAAFLITRSLFADRSKEAEREREYQAILKKFDPFGIEIGESVEVIESRLGHPHIIEALGNDREIRYYGRMSLQGVRELQWVSIIFATDEAKRVFSDDFVDWNKIRELEQGNLAVRVRPEWR